MNKNLALLVLLINGISFAQLSVRNNAYVFVKDQIVFVNDDINLNEANSKIYLRDEAQIIQGTGTTGNSGVGELSVYQTGNVGAYEYNYWCSPVGGKIAGPGNSPFSVTQLNDVVDLTNSNPASVLRLPGYNGISSPLRIESYWIWKYVAGTAYADWIYVGNSATINPGEGFTMKGTLGSGDSQLYDFRGKPNTGTISVNVLAGQFSLVGNPYPSAMDALEFIHDPENKSVITSALYFWDQNPNVNSHNLTAYDGGYATYTISADGATETFNPATFRTYDGNGNIVGTSTTPPSLSKEVKRYIPVGQGFMVEGIADGTVKAKNSFRVYKKESVPSDNSSFYKNTKTKSKVSTDEYPFSRVPDYCKRFRLNVDFNNTYTRQITETFHPSATLNFDYGLEIKINKDELLKSDATWFPNNEPYLAEALPFDADLKIPLSVKIENNMPLRFRIADVQNFDTNTPIYLHDKANDTYVDLQSENFEVNIAKGTYNDRFEITFKNNQTLGVDNNMVEYLLVFQNNNLNELIISNPKNIDISLFQLFDVSGKEVLRNQINSIKQKYNYSTKSLSEGVYVAKISAKNNQVLSKKVVISSSK
ncbi:T9SS type A sorting domain-containing protein [Siansivirga zeaxanthinifaciens]|uniref:Secretion protein n=1 Tax=Siansivirga zeaxanthinifaciens CC-SAMT-1 TaxID=1454006 RepID=A0A0C5VXX8_9FLAO|nr:T9SS type A sorting domain-containing protein [Siansivirga zeaxanthinifaciens]AJR03971.1 secretion protein [Siansivirga zeaxanthinifaciens CC-SAMT-1]